MSEIPQRLVRQRILEGMREVGLLLIAFSPLDLAIKPDDTWDRMALFLLLGFALFATAICIEKKVGNS